MYNYNIETIHNTFFILLIYFLYIFLCIILLLLYQYYSKTDIEARICRNPDVEDIAETPLIGTSCLPLETGMEYS